MTTRKDIKLIVIDLFCGAGGTTTGFMNRSDCMVIACVNHDENAIKSHSANHPECLHFTEDVRNMDMAKLKEVADKYRKLYPAAKLILWASLECTNFSKAKGGQPRDGDSRSLADHMGMYVVALEPDFFMIENVVEFMSWGPLDDKGKPVSRKCGVDYMRWCNEIDSLGYYNEWKELNAANFGAYTSRNRLFGIFAKHGLSIAWPSATHSKKPSHSLFGASLQKWKAVKEVLDFSDEGKSIFDRSKPLSDKTLEVICAGIEKAISQGESEFLFKYYGNGNNLNLITEPAGTVTTKDRFAKVCLIFRDYMTRSIHSVEEPIGSLPTVPKAHLVSFIMNPSHGGHVTTIDNPSPVVVARQDKAPLYLIIALMNEYGIADIKMRMLKISELLKIQGFPENYKLIGTQADQKKFIGNAVHPDVPNAMAGAIVEKLAA